MDFLIYRFIRNGESKGWLSLTIIKCYDDLKSYDVLKPYAFVKHKNQLNIRKCYDAVLRLTKNIKYKFNCFFCFYTIENLRIS